MEEKETKLIMRKIFHYNSFDVRGKPLQLARHWSAPEIFGSRAKFNIDVEPATLDIEDIRRHDEGIYRCRVDFRTTQTQSFRYNLTVISKYLFCVVYFY